MAEFAEARAAGQPLPDWADMQGLVLSSYPHLDQAVYLFFRIEDVQLARSWICDIRQYVTPALKRQSARGHQRLSDGTVWNLNIAFTHWGLQRLWERAEHFSDAFEQGMFGYSGGQQHHQTHRSRLLGDLGDSDPTKWLWGGPLQDRVDVLLMLFVHADSSIAEAIGKVMPQGRTTGAATQVHRIDANRLSAMQGLEHFGFADGISQPILAGSTDAERFPESIHVTALGEIVLGYPNESGQALGQEDRYKRTAELPSVATNHMFGMNGTYVVVRQLAQQVDRFWDWIVESSQAQKRDDPPAQHLAAKLVGRWPDGTPLAPYANRYDNEFMFEEDPYGYGCPMGSHVRRANPRTDIDRTRLPLRLANDHRILRRGRSYEKSGERGLVFICLNADIERQFEFVQQTWINNSAFRGIQDELDPLIGEQGGRERTQFTIPSMPAPHCLNDLPRFVTVQGGQYFFMPGIRALGGLAK